MTTGSSASRHNESLDEQDTRFAFGAAVAGAALGMLGLTAALCAMFISWPDVGRSEAWVTLTMALLQASGLLLLIGMCGGILAVFAPGLPRRLGLLVAVLCGLAWLSVYLYSTWPTPNTLVGAAARGDWEVVRFALMLGVDPQDTADPDHWDPRYGFDESRGRQAMQIAAERGHVRVVRVLQSHGVPAPADFDAAAALEAAAARAAAAAEQDAAGAASNETSAASSDEQAADEVPPVEAAGPQRAPAD